MAGPVARRVGLAVLDQLPDADVGVGQPLQVDGYFNRLLGWLHLGGSRNWLDGDWSTVVIGLVYGYIPFFILPLYAALERLDKRLIEAGRDLGASPGESSSESRCHCRSPA